MSMHRSAIGRTLVALRRPITLGLLGAAILVPAACNVDAGEGDLKGGVLTEAGTLEPRSLNPAMVSDTTSGMLQGLLFDGLLSLKPNGELIPMLAADLPDVSNDGKTYTFTLRDGVEWTDGEPLTADDVVFTYELQYLPKYAQLNSFVRASIQGVLKSVSAPDARTVVFNLIKPDVTFLALHAMWPVVPKHVLGDLTAKEINTSDFNQSPTVTNGQFKFAEWQKGQSLIFEANESYYRGRAKIDRYVYRIVGSTAALGNMLSVGEVDLADVDPSVAEQLSTSDNVRLITYQPLGVEALRFMVDPAKPGGEFFSDAQVRQAIAYAIDRANLVDVAYSGQAEIAYSNQPPSSWAYDPDLEPRYDVDLESSRRLLDEAGWGLGSSGIREKDGQRFEFELLAKSDNKQDERAALLIKEDLRKVGIVVNVRSLTSSAVVDNLLYERSFDAMLEGNTFFTDPTQAIVWSCDARQPGGVNGGLYCNPALDALMAATDVEQDMERRREMFYEQQRILREDLPQLPTVVVNRIWAASTRVDGLGDLGAYTESRQRPWMKDVTVAGGA